MARSAEAIIKPELLTWGRYSSGMPKSVAAKKIGVTVDKLLSWESGESRPTIKQLRKVANVYKQSFAAFFLSEPPEVFAPPLNDFRKISPGEEALSPELILDIRSALDRREIYIDLINGFGEEPPLFKSKTSINTDPEKVASKIRQLLKITFSKQSKWKDNRISFNHWRESIENLGILVFQTTQVSVYEMRGYSIAKFPLPIIAVNRKDSYSGRTFSMMHELTHIMLRESGLCDLEHMQYSNYRSQQIEKFCNHVAGATLVTREHILLDSIVKQHSGTEWEEFQVSSLAEKFCVSREVILRRLLILGKTSLSFYLQKRIDFQKELESLPMKKKGFVPPSTNVVGYQNK
jgi:Zn-dependent peptidase ImmA (M78 family)/DNA-binding XRE family transcriptional regulator